MAMLVEVHYPIHGPFSGGSFSVVNMFELSRIIGFSRKARSQPAHQLYCSINTKMLSEEYQNDDLKKENTREGKPDLRNDNRIKCNHQSANPNKPFFASPISFGFKVIFKPGDILR